MAAFRLIRTARDGRAAVVDLHRPAVGVVLAGSVDAELLVEGGAEILDRDGAFGGVGAVGVAGADDLAAGNAGAGRRDREHARPVVASGGVVDLRGAAELAEGQHERRIEQAPRLHVLQQRREGLIEFGVELGVGLVVVGMGVIPAVEQRHQAHTGLDESAAQQRSLSGGGSPVGVAQLGWLGVAVEGLLGRRRGHQLEGLLVEVAHALADGRALDGLDRGVERGKQLRPRASLLQADARRQGEVLHRILLAIRIAADERVIGRAQEAGVSADVAVRDDDEGRQTVGGPELVGDDGAVDRVLEGVVRPLPGEDVLLGLLVDRLLGIDRADHREAVQHAGAARQQLAEADSGELGGDRGEAAADLAGCVGLGVEGVVLAEPAGVEEDQAGRLLAPAPSGSFQQLGQSDSAERGSAELEQVAARERGGHVSQLHGVRRSVQRFIWNSLALSMAQKAFSQARRRSRPAALSAAR